ncbi:hypothetical protein [Vibrio ziniensis]|uniref:Uncharacterized protein n=1 Tax=Vibrio ziniensis TaxID=2711221 RepID=A0A6G7CLM8_9VIBR|nr:hypothetical protein [Vibrio ziniensis]QIH42953.1 hypothetical protein G5S32_13790 [Vibrio ziniensis]
MYNNKSKGLIKLSILSSTIALALAGCGGGDSSGSSETPSASSYTIQAIDGYLVGAEVYADMDTSNTLTSADVKLGVTGDEGQLAVDEQYKQYPIIIKAIAGQTYDTDNGGYLASDVELIAESGSTVITPFSTYAVQSGQTLDEVATQLGIDVEYISSDYIEKKASSDSDTTNNATKAHLAARSITAALATSLDSEETAGLEDKVNAIKAAVDTAYDNASDKSELDDLVVELDDSNTASTTGTVGTLESAMMGHSYYGVNTNTAYSINEGVSTIYFSDVKNSDGTVDFTFNNQKNGESNTFEGEATFSADGFSFTEDGETSKETIIYYGKDKHSNEGDAFYLDVTSDGDLLVFSTATSAIGFEAEQIAEKSFYVLFDDSTTTTPDVTMVQMTFNTDGSVDLLEGESTSSTTWEITEDGALSVADIYDDGSAWIVYPLVGNDDMYITYESADSYTIANILVKSENFANSLYNRWMKLQ